MAIMEGPLSKWTNVMKGWQYRWFVLDEAAGLLSYYTSKEKMMRGARRGCVRLKGAVIGIDDEDDSTFTITVDQKTFHFQARDMEEKERWIDALLNSILRHSQVDSQLEKHHIPTMGDFDKKLSETDAYLQLLIEQVQALEAKASACEDESARNSYVNIKESAESMIESIKQSIFLLQITKGHVKSHLVNGVDNDDTVSLDVPSLQNDSGLATGASSAAKSSDFSLNTRIKDRLSSNSDGTGAAAHTSPLSCSMPNLPQEDSESDFDFAVNGATSGKTDAAEEATEPRSPPKVIASQDDYFDELYDDNEEEDLESLESHGSMITHLLSQVRIGMDLTKVTLPTFILERRSLLEMFADFFAHPDLFVNIVDQPTPQERMVQTVRWYMSAFHAGRKSHVAKKPYNPIMGETFQCLYDLPNVERSTEICTDGPIPKCRKDNLVFIAEQVSHHPPISAFYAECVDKRISLDGYMWTKSKFLGLSIGVHMIGQGVITVMDHDEDYIITFPNAYGRSILTIPWMELGGKVMISCAKTGYHANIDFLTKPFYGGKKDQITADIFAPNDKKPFYSVKGEWNGIMWAKNNTTAMNMNEIFIDTKSMPIVKKKVKPIEQQIDYESRRLWQDVTYNLKNKNIEAATAGKHRLEQKQREEAKERKESGSKWETRNFHEVGEHWVYDQPLVQRLNNSTSSPASPVDPDET